MTGNGGNIDVATGYSTATSSGSFVFKTPNSGAKGISGAFTFSTGTTSSGDSGGYSMTTGDALNGKSGSMTLKLGTGNVGDGGSFSLDVGDTTGADGNGGSITVVAGHANDAVVVMMVDL